MQNVTLSDWFLSPGNIVVSSLSFYGLIAHFILVLSNFHYQAIAQFIYPCSPTKRYLGCFHGLAVMHKTAVNIHV